MLPRNQRAASAIAVADVPPTTRVGAGHAAEFWFAPIAVFVTISVIFLGNSGKSLFRDPDGPRIPNPLPELLEEAAGGERLALYRIKK